MSLRVIIRSVKVCPGSRDVLPDLFKRKNLALLFAVDYKLSFKNSSCFDATGLYPTNLQRCSDCRMQVDAVHRAVLAAFGKYLYAVGAFGDIDMDLTVFAVHLLFDAHPSTAHLHTMLDAACLDPVLSAYFDAKDWLEAGCQVCNHSAGSVVISRHSPCATLLHATDGGREVIVYFEEYREERIDTL